MTIVAFASQHGGVATTTSAVTIAYALAQKGFDTLLLDLHTQGHCAICLGLDPADSAYEWLIGGQPVLSQTVTIGGSGLRLLRGNHKIYLVNSLYIDPPDGWNRLVQKIRDVGIDRWVVIDSPRSCLLCEAVLAAADVIVIPFRGDSMSCEGVAATRALKDRFNSKAEIILLPTRIDIREGLTRQILAEMQSEYGDQVAMPIPKCAAVARSQNYGETIWDYKGDGIKDVRSAYSALMEQIMPKQGSVDQADEILQYQQLVENLQNQLAEANEWRARHDLQGRMEVFAARLGQLEVSVREVSKLAHEMAAKWEKLTCLFDENRPRAKS